MLPTPCFGHHDFPTVELGCWHVHAMLSSACTISHVTQQAYLMSLTAYSLCDLLPSCLPMYIPAFHPTCLPSCLPTSLPMYMPAFHPACLLACLPALLCPYLLTGPPTPTQMPLVHAFLPACLPCRKSASTGLGRATARAPKSSWTFSAAPLVATAPPRHRGRQIWPPCCATRRPRQLWARMQA